ncbi:hypothetical protein REPUB_Repub04eG0048600 [Reevesia pubescens]
MEEPETTMVEGKASVTLEDVMIFEGLSILGSLIFTPLEIEELKEAEEGLKSIRIELIRSKAKKACPRLWMQKFIDSGSEFEHEAFFAFWILRERIGVYGYHLVTISISSGLGLREICRAKTKTKFDKKKGQPRLAQWHDVSCKFENVRLALESELVEVLNGILMPCRLKTGNDLSFIERMKFVYRLLHVLTKN